ncbi:tagaturonate reductase [Enterococcus sp. BWR-S5]|uniref:tagaturonate reductase n=1 Tax=Enterococcus sp. BWR-S5 TaxID=2787714 RepID=UPI0019234D0F|nr:tagaturonate reductase [Enterococcus sp. BWR-S5]MBL1225192.1 tagaturonate reductase [Enterococcus sp. BWR-S5]
MEKLSKRIIETNKEQPVKVIQFGEGNFMRGFVDWQIQEMNKQQLFKGSVAVVQPIDQGLGEMLKKQDYLYTVILEGLLNKEIINTSEIISVIDTVINPYKEWDDYLALAENDSIEFIVSNTTEAGIQYTPSDQLSDHPQQSYPGKLTALLYRRFELGKKGFTIIPCELIDRNGEKLKEIVQTYAKDWQLGADFLHWLEAENTFCCSLVDRIVPGYPRDSAAELNEKHGYEDSLMVKAEPFMLWVIEGPQSLKESLPLEKAGLNVIVTDDMTPYRERKVHLLNGPHTAMVPLALLADIETVEGVMKDQDFRHFIDHLFSDELIPMLSLPENELTIYAEQIKERFLNPFVHHMLTSIALNSVSKYKARLLPILLDYQKNKYELPPYMTAALAALILTYRGDKFQPQDDAAVITLFEQAWQTPDTVVETILSAKELWGQDLTAVSGLSEQVQYYISQLETIGSRKMIQELNKGEKIYA